MTYKITAGTPGGVRLNETDPVASVLQNIAVILSTRRQSVPLYRDFGLPMRFIDKPLPIARTILAAEITDAVRAFEPRASVAAVDFSDDPDRPGALIPIVEVEIHA
jgi:phage baseplate assembly protein W